MKLAGCENEIVVSLSRKFYEGTVYALRRQLSQILFSLPKCEFVKEPFAQIHRYHSLLGIKEPGKKESKLLGKVVWRNA